MATEEKSTDFDESNKEVLPSNVRPTHYFLSYTNVDLEKEFKFNGKVCIDLAVSEDNVSQIIINSGDITYSSISVTQNDKSSKIEVSSISENKTSQQVTIPLSAPLSKGEAKLEIEFVGILNDNLKGFYRSKYKLGSGEDAFCGCTQFEACDARLAFPCWDEPAAKATFTLQMEYPKELLCISNMPAVKEEEVNDKLKRVTFDKTPKMSTYLLAWVIGEFEYIEAKTSRDIIVRIYTSVGSKDKAQYALKVAVKCLDFYEKYFDIKYPLPKCDMIALADFAAGAMENWGLITYREVRLLCDEKDAALSHKQNVARVICHELAHQWFGNLVTMDWWSQLWLNEGFASFMQYFSADAIEPELSIWNLYMTREYANAFKLDGMSSSHAIEVPVLTAKGADEVFDIISYCKGSCVIVMLQSFLGDDAFQKGLIDYLNKFAYSNAVTTDLWHHLSQSSDKDVGKIMQCWTRSQGFPVIEAEITDKANGKILLKQSRYLSSGRPSKEEDNVVWNVPIVMKIDGKTVRILLDAKQKELVVDEIKTAKYVHLNANSKGFYCTQYNKEMLAALLTNLSDLNDLDKLCLIRDLKALSKSGYMADATEQLLSLMMACKDQQSYIVWNEILSTAADINHLINNDAKIQEKFNAIMCKLLTPIYEYLNKWGDDDDEKQKADIQRTDVFRPMVISSMAKYGNKEVIAAILSKFDEFIVQRKGNIPEALRNTVYSNALKYSSDGTRYEALKKYYMTATDNMDKRRALTCLGSTNDAELILATLKWTKDSDEVRKQDKIFALGTCARSKTGREITWQFLKESISEWKEIYGGGGFILNSVCKLPASFVDDKKADEIEAFFNGLKGFDACQKSMKQCVENVRLNAKWRNAEIQSIQQWIDKN
eukprot:CAMPEP_0197023626 /NCGR_PEP_ID=MMETSP1384-20130603/4294_1 /TAXON_ID=29189 /ORGANISM="Ammonia sp." /LENGTH=884 /DNA_ID=CAMNT_0042451869 /DNA_START=21 /DNA_END=2675 /DNA_ORIENTATION=+